MAGSLAHIVDSATGEFTTGMLNDMGDAREALEECYAIIVEVTGGSEQAVNAVCDRLGLPRIQHDMVRPY